MALIRAIRVLWTLPEILSTQKLFFFLSFRETKKKMFVEKKKSEIFFVLFLKSIAKLQYKVLRNPYGSYKSHRVERDRPIGMPAELL